MALVTVCSLRTPSAAQTPPPLTSAAAQFPTTITGRVTDAHDAPVEGATVTVVALRSGASQLTTTDAAGRYNLRLADDGAEYTITVAASGFAPVRRRVQRTEAARLEAVDVRLRPPTLAPVRVRGTHRPPVVEIPRPGIGAVQQDVYGTTAVSVEAQGDIAALAATVPGVVAQAPGVGSGSSFSVLGLPGDRNQVTLGGLAFPASEVPRNAPIYGRLATSEYDPSVGGFSGGLLALQLERGGPYRQGGVSLLLDDPRLQRMPAAADQAWNRVANTRLSAFLTGPLRTSDPSQMRGLFYSVALEGGRRAAALERGTAGDPLPGVLASEARRLFGALDSLGIPRARELTAPTVRRSASMLARVDINPSLTRDLFIIGNAQWSSTGPLLPGPRSVAPRAVRVETGTAGAQAEFARYFHNRVLVRARTGVSLTGSRGVDGVALPAADVLLPSSAGRAAAEPLLGSTAVQFGGPGEVPSRGHTWTWQTGGEASWLPADGRHLVKSTAELRLDGYSRTNSTDLGTFTFPSVDDVLGSHPTSFTRVLSAGGAAGRALSGAVSLGDVFRWTDRLRMQYGARVELNRYFSPPPYNPLLDRLLGVRTDVVPNRLHVSPRLGVTKAYGTARSRFGAPGMDAEGLGGAPTGAFRAGIGEFRSLAQPDLLVPARLEPGLADAALRVTCVGPAVPDPAWGAYTRDVSAVPTRCAGTSGDAPFTDVAAPATVYEPTYAPPRSWRANLGWTGFRVRSRYRLSVDATYSLALNQPSTRDLNFAAAPQFTIPDDGNRPVFVPPTSVAPDGGALNAAGSRRTDRFGRVVGHSSDLRGESRQVSAILRPAGRYGAVSSIWSLGYALTHAREQYRGFDEDTFDSPLAVHWGSTSTDVRHAFAGTYTRLVAEGWRVSLAGQWRSGLPYTPLVAGDVNGDGLSNDRATIFDPRVATDSMVARGMAGLLRSAPRPARQCLARQLGRVAAHHSCRGPWTAALNAAVEVDPAVFRLPRDRASLIVHLTNLPGAADYILHGAAKSHGWGTSGAPDEDLLTLRRFDPATREFGYNVNPHFGVLGGGQGTACCPFQVTLELRVALAPTFHQQMLSQVLRPGRDGGGPRLTAEQVKQRYASAQPDPVGRVYEARDSLSLTTSQRSAIASIGLRYASRIDSIWTPVAEYVAGLGDRYDRTEVRGRVRDARQRAWDALIDAAREARAVLTPGQFEQLTPYVATYLDEQELRRLRRLDAGA